MTTPPALSIRPAALADEAALGRLAAGLVAVHHAFDPARFIGPTSDTARGYGAFLRSRIGREDSILLVAEEAGELVGYCYAAIEGPDYMALRGPAGVINDVIVDPERRGQGIGRRLLDEILAALTERAVPRAVLFTADRNAGAQRLFARLGFRRTMIEMTWDPPGEPPGQS